MASHGPCWWRTGDSRECDIVPHKATQVAGESASPDPSRKNDARDDKPLSYLRTANLPNATC